MKNIIIHIERAFFFHACRIAAHIGALGIAEGLARVAHQRDMARVGLSASPFVSVPSRRGREVV